MKVVLRYSIPEPSSDGIAAGSVVDRPGKSCFGPGLRGQGEPRQPNKAN